MNKISGQHETAQEICRIIGLEPNDVGRIMIMISPNDIVHAHVTVHLEDEQTKEIAKVFKRFDWVDQSEEK